MKLTRLVLEKNRLSWTFFLLLMVLGLMAYQDFPSREDPSIRIPRATVMTQFPGMPPRQVEDLITRKLEEKFREIGEIKHLVSYSQPGLSIVEVRLHEHIPDFEPVWQKLRHKSKEVLPSLPEGVQGPFVNDEYADVSIVTLALTGDDWSMAELRDHARLVRDQLYTVDGVRRVRLFGVREERVYLEAELSLLDSSSFNIGAAVRSIQDQNRILPAGEVNVGRRLLAIETSGKLETVADLREVVVGGHEKNSLLPLAEYLNIRSDYVNPAEELVYFNGKPTVMISASLQKEGNVKAMGPRLRQFVKQTSATLPVGMMLDVASLQPDAVDKTITMVSGSLYQTLMIVLAVVALALGLREGLILGATVPLTMLAALVILYLIGVELQFVSLASLIISLGMLVDNGIVITEDIHLKINSGVEPVPAALASSSELALPLLTSTLTTVLAFMPILTVNTTAGEFSRSLAQVVGITLLCSWFISVTFVPLLASRLLRKAHVGKKPPASRIYRMLLAPVLKRPAVSLAFIFLLVFGLQSLMKYVTTEMYPPSSRPEVLVYIDLPAGYNIDQTDKVVATLSNWLLDDAHNPDVENLTSYIGTGGPRFSLAIVPNWPAPHRAFMIVKASDAAHAGQLLQDIRSFAAEQLAQASVRTELITRGVVPPGVVELRFSGPDANELYRIARNAEAALAAIPDTLYVRNDWENRTRRLRIVIDQARTYRAGVSFQAVADALHAEFSGRQVSVLRQSDILVPIYIRSPEKDEGSSGSLDLWSVKIPVGDGSGGDYVTLDQVATIEEVVQFGNILRRDLAKTVTVSGKHLRWDSAELQRNWDKSIEEIYSTLPPGYFIELGGELETYSENSGPMMLSIPLFIGLILCAVLAQFNSVRRTLIVLFTIPMAISGGVFGLFVFNANMNFIGMLGFLSLAGIVVNHAIVLIDKADKLVASGLTIEQAAMEAGVHRLRPIIITSATTVLGLVPLLLIEDTLFQSMTIVIMSGLTVGTLFTLIAVPAMYRFLLKDKPTEVMELSSA